MVVAVHENEKTINHKRNRPATFCFVPQLTPSINLTFVLFFVLCSIVRLPPKKLPDKLFS
jgi:hypothetical protein